MISIRASMCAALLAVSACTTSLPISDGGGTCALGATYTYGDVGGLVAMAETTTLSPERTWKLSRSGAGGATTECTQTLATCGGADPIDAGDVAAALEHADVVAAFALATPPLYGTDPRPVDGTVFQLRRADGRGFELGGACGGASGCVVPPAGVVALRDLLTQLRTQEVAKTGCEALR